MKEETKKLLKKRNENLVTIENLKSDNRELATEMCEIEGSCPYCKNWHYPHCGN